MAAEALSEPLYKFNGAAHVYISFRNLTFLSKKVIIKLENKKGEFYGFYSNNYRFWNCSLFNL